MTATMAEAQLVQRNNKAQLLADSEKLVKDARVLLVDTDGVGQHTMHYIVFATYKENLSNSYSTTVTKTSDPKTCIEVKGPIVRVLTGGSNGDNIHWDAVQTKDCEQLLVKNKLNETLCCIRGPKLFYDGDIRPHCRFTGRNTLLFRRRDRDPVTNHDMYVIEELWHMCSAIPKTTVGTIHKQYRFPHPVKFMDASGTWLWVVTQESGLFYVHAVNEDRYFKYAVLDMDITPISIISCSAGVALLFAKTKTSVIAIRCKLDASDLAQGVTVATAHDILSVHLAALVGSHTLRIKTTIEGQGCLCMVLEVGSMMHLMIASKASMDSTDRMVSIVSVEMPLVQVTTDNNTTVQFQATRIHEIYPIFNDSLVRKGYVITYTTDATGVSFGHFFVDTTTEVSTKVMLSSSATDSRSACMNVMCLKLNPHEAELPFRKFVETINVMGPPSSCSVWINSVVVDSSIAAQVASTEKFASIARGFQKGETGSSFTKTRIAAIRAEITADIMAEADTLYEQRLLAMQLIHDALLRETKISNEKSLLELKASEVMLRSKVVKDFGDRKDARMESLQKELKAAHETAARKASDYDQDIRRLRAKIDEHEEELAVQEKQISSRKEYEIRYNELTAAYDSEVEKMGNELCGMKKVLTALQKDKAHTDVEVARLTTEKKSLSSQLLEAEKRRDLKKMRPEEVDKMTVELKTQVDTLNAIIAELKSSNAESDVKKAQHAAAISKLHAANETLQTDNQSLKTANETLKTANETLKTTNETLRSTNEALKSTNDTLKSTNETFSKNIKNLTRSNKKLTDVVEPMEQNYHDTMAQNQKLMQETVSLSATVNAMESRLMDVAEKFEKSDSLCTELRREIATLVPVSNNEIEGRTPAAVDFTLMKHKLGRFVEDNHEKDELIAQLKGQLRHMSVQSYYAHMYMQGFLPNGWTSAETLQKIMNIDQIEFSKECTMQSVVDLRKEVSKLKEDLQTTKADAGCIIVTESSAAAATE